MKISVRTRSRNKFLFYRMSLFIPKEIECVAHTSYHTWAGAADFLHDAIDETTDVLIILDEDAYIIDWQSVEKICYFMVDNGFTHIGVPDGGLLHHRRHSFLTLNPFFTIFNCNLIKPVKAQFTSREINKFEFVPEMELLKPTWITGEYNHDSIEPFAGLFYWLSQYGKPLFLYAKTMDDGTSTEVFDPNGKSICLHSWYSRVYQSDIMHTKRIDELYLTAIRRKRQGKGKSSIF